MYWCDSWWYDDDGDDVDDVDNDDDDDDGDDAGVESDGFIGFEETATQVARDWQMRCPVYWCDRRRRWKPMF